MRASSWAWALVGLGAALPLAAQEAAEVEGLRRRLEEQSRALEDLRREVERLGADPAPTTSTSTWTERVRVGTFWIESADGDHRLALHARLHLDARFDLASDFFDDTFQVRRARVEVDGRVFRKVEYKLGLEFGRTQGANLRDAWIKLVPLEAAQVWAGQMLMPFSTERLTSSNVMKHPERPIVVADLFESRDIGVMLHGVLFEGALRYSAGVYNGNGQNQRVDNDDDKDLAGRLEALPVRWLQLSLNYALSPSNLDAGGPGDVHTVGDEASLFLDYDAANRRRGRRQRMGGGARLRAGPLQLASEWIGDLEEEVLAPSGARDDLLAWSVFVDGSVLLTGEDEADSIRPASPLFGQGSLGPGAFELSLRYEHYRARADVIREGFAVGTDRVDAGTGTLTWIPVEGVRTMASYTASVFDDAVLDRSGHARWVDHVLVLRLALWF